MRDNPGRLTYHEMYMPGIASFYGVVVSGVDNVPEERVRIDGTGEDQMFVTEINDRILIKSVIDQVIFKIPVTETVIILDLFL